MSAGIGAVFGAAGGRGRADAPEAPPSGRGHAQADEPAAPRRESEGGSPGCSGEHSFAPTTRVLMADGTTKPIAEVNVGDRVTATNPATGKTEAKPVVALHLNRDKELTTLTVAASTAGVAGAAADTDTLEATQNHPIWDDSAKAWVEAGHLVPGRSTLTTAYGEDRNVVSVDNHTGSQFMRDLTVADIHTYYVVAGDTPVLVHNSGSNCGIPAGGKIGDELGGQPFHGSDYSLDEYVQFVNGHTGDANPAMGRPTMAQVETTLRGSGPSQLPGQNASVFEQSGVRVIINWEQPWKSTAFYTGS